VYHSIERMATPIGASCTHCDEVFVEGDDGFEVPWLGGAAYMHRECHLRQVLGSVSHIWKRCSCYVPGATCGDPEGMTLREAAHAAVVEYERLERIALT
jgi:hypothetical protein